MTKEGNIMRDHYCICRASEDVPHVFETHVCAGGIWSQTNQNVPSSLEAQVRAVLSRCRQPESDMIPNVSITTRSADSVKTVPPLVEPDPLSMQLMWADTVTTIVLKEGHSHAPRMWREAIKDSGHFMPTDAKFVHRLLEDRILTFFNAGSQREDSMPPPWKTFAKRRSGQSEIWVRPGWMATEIWPDQIKAPKVVEIDPKFAEQRKAFHDAMARKRKRARILEAKGYKQQVATRGHMIGAKVWTRP